jgi:hypothetical protein
MGNVRLELFHEVHREASRSKIFVKISLLCESYQAYTSGATELSDPYLVLDSDARVGHSVASLTLACRWTFFSVRLNAKCVGWLVHVLPQKGPG